MRHPREGLALRAELDEPERAQVTAHLLNCDACRALLRELEAAQRALSRPEPLMQLPTARAPRRKAYGGLRATTVTLVLLAALTSAVMSLRSGVVNDAAASAPPTGSDTRPSTPGPTSAPREGWPAGTVAEVQTNMARDENVALTLRALTSSADADPRAVGRSPTIGTPLPVRGLRVSDAREYLVPVLVDDQVIAVMRIAVDGEGRGALVATRGWSSGPSFPALSAEEARARAASVAGPTTAAELVWTLLPGKADELSPFWRVTHTSGRVSYVFEDGSVYASSDLGIE